MTVVDLAEARFACAVERLHRRGPCALLEMLTELGATWLLRTEIEQLVDRYARHDPVTPAAAGGGRVAAPLIHLISRLDVALGHLRDAEADVADPVVLHELDLVGLALEDARNLASGPGCAS